MVSAGSTQRFSNHLGSTSLTTDANGNVVSELRYCEASLWDKPWGEVRYAGGTTPTQYQYTSQYSYESDFGLLFFNARWVDPSIGRFAQADTIIPLGQGVQAWDRYAFVNNNPLRYTDPSGHSMDQGDGGCVSDLDCAIPPVDTPIVGSGGSNGCSGPNPSVVCLPASESAPELEDLLLTIPTDVPYIPSPHDPWNEIYDVFQFYDIFGNPANDFLGLADVYRMSSRGGWKVARMSLNLWPLEGFVGFVRQVYNDNYFWSPDYTPLQHFTRGFVAGAEAVATDQLSDKIGDGIKVLGGVACGAPCATAGKLMGNTLGTEIGDSFWQYMGNPWISNNFPAIGSFP